MIEPTRVGIVGIGLLGSAISDRLLAVDTPLCGYDTDADSLTSFAKRGGIIANDAAQVIRTCQTVLLSLPESETVSTLVTQLRPMFESGQIVIDTTTGDPEQVIAIGDSLATVGVEYVEATVAGSSDQVRDGEAALFVGGAPEAFDRVRHLLETISNKYFYTGPIGSASRMKLVHNLVLGLNRAVLAEGLMFAKGLGIEPSEALRILQQTPAATAAMETKGPRMVRGDFTPQARLAQHLKDVRLILAASDRANGHTPLSELHRQLLERAVELGLGDLDNSAIIELFRRSTEADQ